MLPDALAPFRAVNFLKFWIGQAISLTGSWLTSTAMNWHVYALTGSVVVQGWFVFALQIPTTLLAPVIGVGIDRVDRHRFLTLTQAAGMTGSLLLAAFAWFDGASLPILATLTLLRGLVSAAEVPARQVMVLRFVGDPALLGRAIALNSTLFNLTRFLGPALAGWLYVFGNRIPGPLAGGAALCFLLDALSYLPVLLLTRGMTLAPEPARPASRTHPLRDLAEGVRYAREHRASRLLLPVSCVLSIFGLSYSVMLPRLAKDTYAGDSRTYGAFLAAVAVGALAGAVALALDHARAHPHRRLAAGALMLGVALASIAFTPPEPVLYLVLALAGGGGVTAMATTNTLLQSSVEERFRGRVMGLFHTSFSGMLPFGALLIGYLGDFVGARPSLIGCALICLLVAKIVLRSGDACRPAA